MMTAAIETDTPARAYARMLRQLHTLIHDGRGDSEEAEALADQMDAPWASMSEQEQERMDGLSEDLYALSEDTPTQTEMSSAEIDRWRREARAALEAFHQGRYDETLAFLRRPIPPEISPAMRRFLQSRCWQQLGDPETAMLFMKGAERHDPRFAVFVLILLQRMGPSAELTEYANRLLDDPEAAPEELYLAAGCLLVPVERMGDDEARPHLERIIPLLEKALKAERTKSVGERKLPEIEPGIAALLGLSYERLGSTKRALDLYDQELDRYPAQGSLLTLRGLARLRNDDLPGAVADFRRAVQAGVPMPWPYFFLAYLAILNRDYHATWRLSVQALEQPVLPSELRAQLHEMLGISFAELGQPLDRVREQFNRALELDPASERIPHNKALAEALRASPRTSGWQLATPVLMAKKLMTNVRGSLKTAILQEENLLEQRQGSLEALFAQAG